MRKNELVFHASDIILSIGLNHKTTMSNVAKNIYTTYAFVNKLTSILKKAGLLLVTKNGNAYLLELTEKGEKISKELTCIYHSMNWRISNDSKLTQVPLW